MKHIELYVRKRDWIIIVSIGLFFSSFLSMFIYFLLDLKLLHGLIFGLILGGLITFLAMLFISLLNNHILPDIAKKYWLFLAVIFSFLSGFCGTIITLFLALFLKLDMIEKLVLNPVMFAILIGVLTYFVGALMYSLVKMANIKEENEKKLIESRLSSLETQLNPHFLFNSLNSLAELIHSDTQKSENMILKLSSFLRGTMAEKPLVSLDEELRYTKEYIELENIRFEDSIKLNIEATLQDIKVPKFSIQLIVENAIKHGMVQNESLEVSIKVLKDEDIKIFISNNGKAIKNSSFGIGLKNLQERLELLCGGKLELVDTNNPTYLISIGECNENISGR